MCGSDSYGPPVAVQQATTGAESWRSVVHSQRPADPDHGDWYAITGEIVDTLRSLSALSLVLGQQIARYGEGRELRDDEGTDPAERIGWAVAYAYQLRAQLDVAERTANHLWSQLGHIGTGGAG